MSANPPFVTHRHAGALRSALCRAFRGARARAFLMRQPIPNSRDSGRTIKMFAKPQFRIHCLPFLLLLILLAAPVVAVAQAQQGAIRVAHSVPVDIAPGEPGPGDNMLFRENGKLYAATLSFTTNAAGQIVTYEMDGAGIMNLLGRTPAGEEPRQLRPILGRRVFVEDGELVLAVANSFSDEIRVHKFDRREGLFDEVSRSPSGGDNPYDIAAFGRTLFVVNRDSDTLTWFFIEEGGQLRPLGAAPTGRAPHALAISPGGTELAVANQGEGTISLYAMDPQGNITSRGPDISVAPNVPRNVDWGAGGDITEDDTERFATLFVAVDVQPGPGTPQPDDAISSWRVTRNALLDLQVDQPGDTPWQPSFLNKAKKGRTWQVDHLGDTPAGAFLTDIEVAGNRLFAATVNRNGPGGADDRDEIRVYRIEGTQLTLDAAVQTDAFPPSFKQLSTIRGRKRGERHVIVSEFQSGWLRSLIYDRRRSPRP